MISSAERFSLFSDVFPTLEKIIAFKYDNKGEDNAPINIPIIASAKKSQSIPSIKCK